MEQLEKDIQIGLQVLRNGFQGRVNSNEYDRVLVNTDEFLQAYYPKFEIDGKNVLTLASGGDHLLQAVFMGANRVDCFDKNRFAIYMTKLKLAAVKSLSREEFIKYFYYQSYNNYFGTSLYKKLRDALEPSARIFWDKMYRVGDMSNNATRLTVPGAIKNGVGSFLYKENYQEMKERLDSVYINYYCADIFELIEKLPEDVKYDSVFLSNIYDAIIRIDSAQVYSEFVEKLSKFLNDDGKMAVYVPRNNPLPTFVEYENADSLKKFSDVIVYQKTRKENVYE